MNPKSNSEVTRDDNGSGVSPVAKEVIAAVINFLQLFLCKTLAKRIIVMVLLSVGVSDKNVSELTGVCDRSVRGLRKDILSDDISGLFHIGGSGRPRKLRDVETAIIEEISTSDYHSQQQIADMILEKFGIQVSLQAVSSLLKKIKSSG